jgi:hypothetical protein
MADPSIRVDLGKFYEPVLLTCKFKVDSELVLKCQRMGDKPHRGTPIGKIVELYPYDQLKRIALSQAKTFVRHMRTQGFEPQEAESAMELWGPYREKLNMAKGASLVNFEEGNPLIPQGHHGSAAYGGWEHDLVKGPRALDRNTVRDHRDWKQGVVFLIRGSFLGTRGHREETTGTTIV